MLRMISLLVPGIIMVLVQAAVSKSLRADDSFKSRPGLNSKKCALAFGFPNVVTEGIKKSLPIAERGNSAKSSMAARAEQLDAYFKKIKEEVEIALVQHKNGIPENPIQQKIEYLVFSKNNGRNAKVEIVTELSIDESVELTEILEKRWDPIVKNSKDLGFYEASSVDRAVVDREWHILKIIFEFNGLVQVRTPYQLGAIEIRFPNEATRELFSKAQITDLLESLSASVSNLFGVGSGLRSIGRQVVEINFVVPVYGQE